MCIQWRILMPKTWRVIVTMVTDVIPGKNDLERRTENNCEWVCGLLVSPKKKRRRANNL